MVLCLAGVGRETRFTAMQQTDLRPPGAAAVSAPALAAVVLGLIRLREISYLF